MPRTDKLSTYRTTVATDAHGHMAVTYVSTAIVKVHNGGTFLTITLDSGGWQTVTTKRKMNQAAAQFGLGYGVAKVKGEWFVDVWDAGKGECGGWLGLKIPFKDGMTFSPGGIRESLRKGWSTPDLVRKGIMDLNGIEA